jgi:hypothetical protein
MFRDLRHNVKAVRAISAVAIGTTGTGKTSGIIDRLGYQGVEFVFNYGTITATNAVFTPNLTECDTTGGSFTSVADVDMLGTEAAAGIGATASRVSGVSKNTNKQLSYLGAKRYLKVKVASTVTAGTPVGVDALLHSPNHAPVGATEL